MATNGHYALRLPASLMTDLRTASERESVSMNGTSNEMRPGDEIPQGWLDQESANQVSPST